MTSRSDLMRRLDALGVRDAEVGPGERRGSYVVDLWSPTGQVFAATMGHSLRVSSASDAAACRSEAMSMLSGGLAPCEEPGCEGCDSDTETETDGEATTMRETTTNEARRIANRIRQNARDVDETACGGTPSAEAWAAFSARNRALWDEANAAGVIDEVTRIVAARVGGAS